MPRASAGIMGAAPRSSVSHALLGKKKMPLSIIARPRAFSAPASRSAAGDGFCSVRITRCERSSTNTPWREARSASPGNASTVAWRAPSSTRSPFRRSAASPLATSTPPEAGRLSRESSANARSKSAGEPIGPMPRPSRSSGTQILPAALHAGSRRESPPEWSIRMRLPRRRSRVASAAMHRMVLPPLPMRLPAGSASTTVVSPAGSAPSRRRMSSIRSA